MVVRRRAHNKEKFLKWGVCFNNNLYLCSYERKQEYK